MLRELDVAFEDGVHRIAGVAFGKDDVAGRVVTEVAFVLE
jgi:hypothetical protein